MNKKGEKLYTIKYTKYKDDSVVRPIMEDASYGFVTRLMDATFKKLESTKMGKAKKNTSVPPTLSATHTAYKKVPKMEKVEKHQSRFAKHLAF